MKKVGIIIILLLAVTSCKKTKVSTKFNPDGSCVREQEITSNKNNFESKNLYFPIDSTWNVTIQKDSASDNFKLKAIKNFLNADEINAEYNSIENKFSTLNRELSFKRNFRWFYTYFKYSEKYDKVFNGPDINDYLSKSQMDAIYSESDESLDSLEGIFEDYYSDCIVDGFYDVLEQVLAEHSFLGNEMKNILDTKEAFRQIAKNDTASSLNEVNEFLEIVIQFSGNDKIKNISDDEAFTIFNQKMELTGELFIDEILNEVEMPGLILKTNADELLANKASWDIRLDKILSSDYKMYVESRIINKWAFYISFFIIILAGVLGVIRLRSLKH